MRYVLGIILVMLFSVACSAKPVVYTPEQLKAALLTADDLGGKWKVMSSSDGIGTTTPTPTATPNASPTATGTSAANNGGGSGCAYLKQFVGKGKDAAEPAARADRPSTTFSVDTFGPFMSHKVYSPGEAEAKKSISQLATLVSNCKTFQIADDDGTASQFTVERIDLKNAADDTIALRLGTTAPPSILGTVKIEVDLVMVRRAGVVSQMSWVGLNSSPDTGFIQRLTDTVGTKLKNLNNAPNPR